MQREGYTPLFIQCVDTLINDGRCSLGLPFRLANVVLIPEEMRIDAACSRTW